MTDYKGVPRMPSAAAPLLWTFTWACAHVAAAVVFLATGTWALLVLLPVTVFAGVYALESYKLALEERESIRKLRWEVYLNKRLPATQTTDWDEFEDRVSTYLAEDNWRPIDDDMIHKTVQQSSMWESYADTRPANESGVSIVINGRAYRPGEALPSDLYSQEAEYDHVRRHIEKKISDSYRVPEHFYMEGSDVPQIVPCAHNNAEITVWGHGRNEQRGTYCPDCGYGWIRRS